jgi:hypothetical protein
MPGSGVRSQVPVAAPFVDVSDAVRAFELEHLREYNYKRTGGPRNLPFEPDGDRAYAESGAQTLCIIGAARRTAR